MGSFGPSSLEPEPPELFWKNGGSTGGADVSYGMLSSLYVVPIQGRAGRDLTIHGIVAAQVGGRVLVELVKPSLRVTPIPAIAAATGGVLVLLR